MVNTKLTLKNPKNSSRQLKLFKSGSKVAGKQPKLTKSWVAGFIDGEGCFALEKVEIKSTKNHPGCKSFIRPILSISQNDPQLLYKIRDYFGCGKVTQKNKTSWHFRCRNPKDFENFIIPRLKDAPFQTIKQYQLELIRDQAMHLFGDKSNENELLQILKKIQDSRNNFNYTNQNPIDFDWFLGFFEGEGNFFSKLKHFQKIQSELLSKCLRRIKMSLIKSKIFGNLERSSLRVTKDTCGNITLKV